MRFDIEAELRLAEMPIDQIALDFRYIDAVGGEAAKRLVKRGGYAAYPEYQSRHAGSFTNLRPLRFLRQDQKTRDVVIEIGDAASEALQAIDLAGEFGCHRGDRLVFQFRDVRRRASGVDGNNRLHVLLPQPFAALGKRLHMAVRFLDVA